MWKPFTLSAGELLWVAADFGVAPNGDIKPTKKWLTGESSRRVSNSPSKFNFLFFA